MKKKFGILLFVFLLAFLLTSCDEVLSVVTVDKNGEKVMHNYVSLFGDKVYDKTISFKSWSKLDLDKDIDMDKLLFKIESKEEKIIVLGDKDAAIEISFFDGGYKYKIYSSMDSLSKGFGF